VRDQPDDDTPRLILADWLEENGLAERAEFVRVQCQMTRAAAAWGRKDSPTWNRFDQRLGREVADLDPEYAALHARARALLAEHGARWADGLPAPVLGGPEQWPTVGTWTVFDRGMPTFYVKWENEQPDPHEALDGLWEASRKPAFVARACHATEPPRPQRCIKSAPPLTEVVAIGHTSASISPSSKTTPAAAGPSLSIVTV
jgi:uncharacterized protein (TIGR02996 family)